MCDNLLERDSVQHNELLRGFIMAIKYQRDCNIRETDVWAFAPTYTGSLGLEGCLLLERDDLFIQLSCWCSRQMQILSKLGKHEKEKQRKVLLVERREISYNKNTPCCNEPIHPLSSALNMVSTDWYQKYLLSSFDANHIITGQKYTLLLPCRGRKKPS